MSTGCQLTFELNHKDFNYMSFELDVTCSSKTERTEKKDNEFF